MGLTPTENGELARQILESRAGAKMPPPVLLEVVDGSQQFIAGWVWCNHENSRVKCVVSGAIDYTEGVHNVWAFPMGSGATAQYIEAGFSYNGADNSRVPRLRVRSKIYTNDVSNPPTDAQLDAIFGSPASIKGELVQLDDNSAAANCYLIGTDADGTVYVIYSGTIAA